MAKRRKKIHAKSDNRNVTFPFLVEKSDGLKNAGYDKPKWIVFCEIMLRDGYTVSLYEARQTVSKYVTVSMDGRNPFKVRFSNHKPIRFREVAGDCDFFVGITHLGITTTGQAVVAVREHFKKKGLNNGNINH